MSKQEIIIFNESPLIKGCTNFLSKQECKELIKYSKNKLEQSEVIDGVTGENKVNVDYRSASTCTIDPTTQLNKKIFKKLEKFLNISSDNYESASITHYSKGQLFKVHADYFELNKCKSFNEKLYNKGGGNRIGTIIIYLNDVQEGGETAFPWLRKFIKPVAGGLVYFKYDYADSEVNIRTEHESIPVVTGEKYILTVWIREQSLNTKVAIPLEFKNESAVRANLVDSKFSILCGSQLDTQMLSVTLPANGNPNNAIVVPFTGGMDSSLLLFLICVLNQQQRIPYHIIPICIYIENDTESFHNLENHENAIKMLKLINSKVDGNITNLMVESGTSIREGILKFKSNAKRTTYWWQLNKLYVYSAENALPTETDAKWMDIKWQRIRSEVDFWKQPFFNLQKYHIVDAILQLGLEDIIEHTQKCVFNHPSLDHMCEHVLCNERRWAFTKLNKEAIGNKYFINKGL